KNSGPNCQVEQLSSEPALVQVETKRGAAVNGSLRGKDRTQDSEKIRAYVGGDHMRRWKQLMQRQDSWARSRTDVENKVGPVGYVDRLQCRLDEPGRMVRIEILVVIGLCVFQDLAGHAGAGYRKITWREDAGDLGPSGYSEFYQRHADDALNKL